MDNSVSLSLVGDSSLRKKDTVLMSESLQLLYTAYRASCTTQRDVLEA